MNSQKCAQPISPATGGNCPAVTTVNLSKRYGNVLAVDNLNLTVPEGTIFGLLGPNGAGKTTTMRMLLGLIRPTSGFATVLGQDCRDPRTRRPGMVGAFVEGPAFYPYLAARENLHLLCDLSGAGHDTIPWALETVGLAEYANYPYRAYSHGMRQRLGIAAALLPRPRLLILDEPASGLDPAGMREVRGLLKTLASQGITILLSSHLLHEVQQVCTHVAIMFRGRLVACGPVEALLDEDTVAVTVVVDDTARAKELLASHGHRWEIVASGDGSIDILTRRDTVAELNAALVHAGLRVFALCPRHKSLEDLYMEYAERVGNGTSIQG
jgi:ABC-2 type transport system ATP-binding protein